MSHIRAEISRRATQSKNKLDYGLEKKGHTPSYRKANTAPENYTIKNRQNTTRGIGSKDIHKHSQDRSTPAPVKQSPAQQSSSGIASSSV